MTNLEGCKFCDPKSEDLRPRLINLGSWCYSALSNPRITRGHALVIPNRHVEDPTEVDERDFIYIQREIIKLQRKILLEIAPGVDVWQKYQPFVEEGHAGTKMNHVHYHVIPRNPADGLLMSPEPGTDTFSPLCEEERIDMLEILGP